MSCTPCASASILQNLQINEMCGGGERQIGCVEVNQALESMWRICRVVVESFLTNFGCAMEVCWRCAGGRALWRHVEVIQGPLGTVFSPSFLPSVCPLKRPSISPPFHSLIISLFSPCQSPSLKSLSCQFSPPMIFLFLLFCRPSSSPLLSSFYSSSLTYPSLFLFSNGPYLIFIIIFLFYIPSLPLASLL